jgi:hypothetical protein
MFQTKVVEKIQTYLVFNNFFPKIVPFERMWKNAVEPDRLQMTI